MRKIIRIIKKWLLKRRPRKKKETSSEKRRIAQGVRQFFEQNYELRYNEMKQTEEFRRKPEKARLFDQKAVTIGQQARLIHQKAVTISREAGLNDGENGNEWRQLTDRELRRIAIEQMEQVGVAWSIDVELYVRSALVPNYNPVTEFLHACGTWDGREDHIRQLARRVPTSSPEWPERFHRWMLAMVAQWMNLSRDYGNAVVPMLIGAQGTRKSTFCKLILPPELREYYIDDVKLDNAEQVERMLGRMLLVNIDEYNAKTDREQAKIKRILTEKDIQTRRMRSDQYVMRQRTASFIATTNDLQPLCDPTGSRRYLCCEVEGIIDTDTPIDYRQLYAQAVTELRSGAPWHFTKAEEAEIERHNQDYRNLTSPEAVLTAWFEPAEPCKEHFVRAVDIQAELRTHVRAADVPTIGKLTGALKSCRFRNGKIGGIRGWYAKKREYKIVS